MTKKLTPPLYPRIGDALADQSDRRGSDTALIFGSRRTSFFELNQRATRIAHALNQSLSGRNSVIGVLARNSDRYVQVIFGAARAGALLLVINWRLARAELEFIVEDTRLRILFFDPEFSEEARNLQLNNPELLLVSLADGVPGMSLEEFASLENLNAEQKNVINAHDPAVMLYTSGTTGRPKGIVISHFGALHNLTQPSVTNPPTAPRPDDVVLLSPPLFHISGLLILLGAVIVGARTVVLTEARMKDMVTAIIEHKVTRAVIIPVLMPQLVEATTARGRVNSLRTVLYGMSAISEETLRSMFQALQCEFVQQLGLTEASGSITQLGPEDHYPGSRRLSSCGRSLPDVDLSVRHDDGSETEIGEPGEVFFRSPSLAVGIWRSGELMPLETVDGWLSTGDIGYLDADGYLYLCDRKKDMIVSGGENVYSAEVEAVLSRHPDVERVAVIGIPSEKWGEEVKAVVVSRRGATPTVLGIIEFARKSLAGYKVPKTVDFVVSLPLTSVGKVAKNLLREPYWRGKTRRIN